MCFNLFSCPAEFFFNFVCVWILQNKAGKHLGFNIWPNSTAENTDEQKLQLRRRNQGRKPTPANCQKKMINTGGRHQGAKRLQPPCFPHKRRQTFSINNPHAQAASDHNNLIRPDASNGRARKAKSQPLLIGYARRPCFVAAVKNRSAAPSGKAAH